MQKLRFVSISIAGSFCVCERLSLPGARRNHVLLRALVGAGLLALQGVVVPLRGQHLRMIIDGSIRVEGNALPANTRIRILREDGTVARTVGFYDPRNLKFGIRLSTQDGFHDNEKILFRVVPTAQDSFLARFVGPPLVFKGERLTSSSPTEYVLLFRNSLPTIYRQVPDTAIDEDQQIRYRVVAIDRDADTVRFALKNPPQGCRIDSITGMFSWRPTFDQAGKYRIPFLISDGYDTDSSRVTTIVVHNVNRRPRFVITPGDTTIREADSLRWSLLAIDPDGDPVFYRPYQIPDGMRLDSISGVVRWCPTFDQAGRYIIRFVASDGMLGDTSQRVSVTVQNVDRPPVVVRMLPDTTINENDSLSFSMAAKDPDGDSVWFALRDAPAGMVISPGGTLAWRPSFIQAGRYSFRIGAHDQDSATEVEAHIRVLNTDRPPLPTHLHEPRSQDTIRLALNKPVRFAWAPSFDPDTEDVVRYRIHIWGPQLDTLVVSHTDTAIALDLKPHLVPFSLYRWDVVSNDGTVSVVSSDTFSFRTSAGIVGSTELLSQIPRTYYLEQSLPDPFNPLITIKYALPERSYVKLAIFNMLGEPLLVLVSGEKDAGVYDVTFDASEFTSGAYMFRLDAHPLGKNSQKDFVNTKKMFIVR